jgi:hypothetical protein
VDTTIAFVRTVGPGRPELVVNFGLLCGREATIAEVDRLARRFCDVLGETRIHAVRTHDMSPGSESVIHQVVADGGGTSDAETLRAICEAWAKECAADRTLEPLGS